MSLSGPNKTCLADTPKITLAGQDWPIPKLTLRQNIDLQNAYASVGDRIIRDGVRVTELTSEDLMKLADVVRIGLSRAHPTVNIDDVLALDTGASELVPALLVIMQQSGLWRPVENPGEDPGEPSPQTGTAS